MPSHGSSPASPAARPISLNRALTRVTRPPKRPRRLADASRAARSRSIPRTRPSGPAASARRSAWPPPPTVASISGARGEVVEDFVHHHRPVPVCHAVHPPGEQLALKRAWPGQAARIAPDSSSPRIGEQQLRAGEPPLGRNSATRGRLQTAKPLIVKIPARAQGSQSSRPQPRSSRGPSRCRRRRLRRPRPPPSWTGR